VKPRRTTSLAGVLAKLRIRYRRMGSRHCYFSIQFPSVVSFTLADANSAVAVNPIDIQLPGWLPLMVILNIDYQLAA